MKIERVNVKHKTWLTRVTVGEEDDVKTFGLRQMEGETHRVYIPFKNSTSFKDFDNREAAMGFCQGG